ncbi:MAG TPA: substrate-binding domain-containing protein [Bryobacteraceae bacterium]|nr:substrate-binding domain-containing protein [Bryobacteraceae bacterium]
MKVKNRLAEIRQARGFGAAELAKAGGVTRQTIYAIEAGAYVPNTAVALRLAQTLEVRVEELFSLDDGSPAPVITEDVEMLPGGQAVEPGLPVQLCQVDKRIMGVYPSPVAWHLPVADAVVVHAGGKGADARKARVQVFGAEGEAGHRLLMAGCDPAMTVLARHVRKGNVELVLAHRNSSQSLVLLREGLVHVAGSHLRDEATGESNLPHVRKLFPRGTVSVITFAMWEEGIVVAKGNPKSIREIGDFARKGVTLVNREAGSGSRILLDSSLKRLGIPIAKVTGYGQIAYGHLPAAWQVRVGQADGCVATRAAARIFGLDFVPLIGERYDLVIRKPHLALPAVQLLLDTLSRTAFRRELEGLGGYTTSDAGKQVA